MFISCTALSFFEFKDISIDLDQFFKYLFNLTRFDESFHNDHNNNFRIISHLEDFCKVQAQKLMEYLWNQLL